MDPKKAVKGLTGSQTPKGVRGSRDKRVTATSQGCQRAAAP